MPDDLSTSARTWQRNLYAIWLAELIAIAGTNALVPLLPLYMPRLGIEEPQQVAMWSGIVFSVYALSIALFGPVWGALSDRYSRRFVMLMALFGGGGSIVLMGLAQNVVQLTVLRAMQGALGAMIIPAATTLVATTVPKMRVGYSLGMLRAVIYAGASAGLLMGGLVADSIGYRVVFGFAGGLVLAAALIVWFFVRETFEPSIPSADAELDATVPVSERGAFRRVASALGLSSMVLVSVLGLRVFMRFGFHATRPIVPLLIVSVADTDVRVASASGLIAGVSMAVGALGAVVLGRLGDRVHYRTVLIACALVSAAVYVAHGFVSDLTGLMLLQAMAAVAMSGILVSIFALLARAAPRGQEGAVYALDQTVDTGVGSIAPLAGSALAATRGLRTAFLFAGAAFGLASIVATWRLPKR